jgi:hypothetical protein
MEATASFYRSDAVTVRNLTARHRHRQSSLLSAHVVVQRQPGRTAYHCNAASQDSIESLSAQAQQREDVTWTDRFALHMLITLCVQDAMHARSMLTGLCSDRSCCCHMANHASLASASIANVNESMAVPWSFMGCRPRARQLIKQTWAALKPILWPAAWLFVAHTVAIAFVDRFTHRTINESAYALYLSWLEASQMTLICSALV